MEPQLQTYLEEFGAALLGAEELTLRPYFATWCSSDYVSELLSSRADVEKRVREEWSDTAIGPASSYELDWNSCDVTELREDGLDLPDELGPDNFVLWASIQIAADDGEWALCEYWFAVAKESGRYVIGHCEIAEPD